MTRTEQIKLAFKKAPETFAFCAAYLYFKIPAGVLIGTSLGAIFNGLSFVVAASACFFAVFPPISWIKNGAFVFGVIFLILAAICFYSASVVYYR